MQKVMLEAFPSDATRHQSKRIKVKKHDLTLDWDSQAGSDAQMKVLGGFCLESLPMKKV